MKKAIIIGATSGIGREVALCLLKEGWRIGVAGRRESALKELQQMAPEQVVFQTLNVTGKQAVEQLQQLIQQTGGMDLFLLSSGIGFQNMELNQEIEWKTTQTNVVGFTRMVDAAFTYFKEKRNGHIAVISSIAGTKGIGVAPAYSATKRYQNTYIDALEQLAHIQKLNIHFTDIRPGFVATALLNDGKQYPMLMNVERVGRLITRALLHQKRVAIIDNRYRFLVFFWRLIPQWLWKRLPIRMA